jgi:hypothetical protein
MRSRSAAVVRQALLARRSTCAGLLLLAVTAGALSGCEAGTVGPTTSPLDPHDAVGCDRTRSIVMAAEQRLEDIVRSPTEASERYRDFAESVRASTTGGSAPLAAAGERLASAYERLSANAVTGAGPDLGVLRAAVADFVDGCGVGTISSTSGEAR